MQSRSHITVHIRGVYLYFTCLFDEIYVHIRRARIMKSPTLQGGRNIQYIFKISGGEASNSKNVYWLFSSHLLLLNIILLFFDRYSDFMAIVNCRDRLDLNGLNCCYTLLNWWTMAIRRLEKIDMELLLPLRIIGYKMIASTIIGMLTLDYNSW